MKRTLSDWANIAEVVSGIAVVITLIFLIAGIRDNTEVTRASMFQRSTDRIIEWRRDILNDPVLASLFQKYLDGDAASIAGTDQTRLAQIVLNQFQIYEQAYFADLSGLLGPAEWRRFERQACLFYPRIQSTPSMAENLSLVLTSAFEDYLRTTCRE